VGDNIHGECGARTYIGDPKALPPVGSRDNASSQVGGQGAKPPEADEISALHTLILP
jgi:hypothetical protein